MLAMEEKTAAFYLVEVSRALSTLGKGTGFYPMAFGLVANGLESLLDVVMIAGTLRSELPSRTEFKTHDLLKLSETALLPKSGTAGAGRLLLRDDEILASLLATLSDFARGGRYLYMDGVLQPRTPHSRSR
jgi:hypothetical protein